jgi:hypothetical protein
MIFGNDKSELRKMYFDAWAKAKAGTPLSPLDGQISQVVAEHPEYHSAIEGEALEATFTPDGGQTNPYLHMGLHLAIRDQVSTDRPPGVRALYESIARKSIDTHAAEHQMLECLAETLWDAQRAGQLPDEQKYLERLRVLDGRLR